ncbi:hypothetical protein OA90_21585, partial [Labrenzia sp. OB1]
TGLNLPEALRACKLAEQKGQKLGLRRQTADAVVRFMLIHKAIELAPRNMLQHLMKNAIVMAHDIDPLFVSQTRPNV